MYAHNTNRHPANNPNTAVATSPVCGSLDPPSRSKKTAKSGWRYIQCGDSLDELRVLIPPRPAAIYANLLKVEAHSLAKNDADSARDVQYIHQLKDAMIKRCQKLAQQAISASPDPLNPRTAKVVEAPLDFKLRRLEMWWETMEAHGKAKGSPDQPQPTHSARPGRRSKVHATSSTATVAPNKNQLAVSVAHANGSHVVSPQTSPNAQRTSEGGRRPAPINVSPSSQAVPGQPSPSMAHSPHKQMRPSHQPTSSQTSLTQSPYTHVERPHLRPAMAYRPAYSNSQTTSPMDMHSPYFDPNKSLAATSASAQQYHASPAASRNGLAPHSPNIALRNDAIALANDPRLNRQVVYSIADAMSEPTAAQVDPSFLKNRFNATYISSSSNSTSSPSSSSSKPSPYTQQHPSNSRENVGAYYTQDHLQPALGHANHTRARASLSMPLPGNAGSSSSDREHRRRATVDCDDTDRSVPRPKGYMYSSTTHYSRPPDTLAPDMLYNEQAYDAQGIRQADADHSPSALRRVAQAIKQSFLPGGSPMSSAGSGSPRSRGSPSGHSQGSPGNHSQQGYSYTNGGAYNGSPNLLPPAPALSRSRRASNESVIQANKGVQENAAGYHPKQQLRRTVSRRGLRDRSPSGVDPAAVQALAPTANYYATQARSPRKTTLPTPDTHQPTEGDNYRRGRTRRGERSPRRSYGYDASPRRGDPVIPDMAILTPATSARNSRYTSGGSSVSEPVIPDVSLIMEAELSRSKADRVRRRLVPCRSSSEEGGGRYDSDSDSDLSDSDENDGHGGGETDYYRRPYRARDGYGSEYASDAGGMGSRAPSRTPSRPPSRPPSRGILKRSSSMCSQRSSKSVRLEIPRDRRALEEVRDAEDKVDRAQKQLEDFQKRTGGKSKIADAEISRATEALNQAKRSLKEKDDEYQTILEAMKLKRSEQEEAEPRYV